MYADRVEVVTKRSIKDRLNGNTADDFSRRRQITGKRHREEDDKWEHDLYERHEVPGSSQRIGAKDLRLKLQKKNIQQASQIVKGSVSGGMRDLREKLSGTVLHSQTVENDPPKAKLKVTPEISKPVRRSSITEALDMETKKIASTVSKKKSQQKISSKSPHQSFGIWEEITKSCLPWFSSTLLPSTSRPHPLVLCLFLSYIHYFMLPSSGGHLGARLGSIKYFLND